MFSTSTSAVVDQAHQHLVRRRGLEVERQRPLVAVQVLEVAAVPAAADPPRPRPVAGSDPDDVGAPVGELAHAGRPGPSRPSVARAGPTCVRQLADWGADVVRVEWPAEPAASGKTGGSRHGADFQHLHRNKRSLSLNLKAPAAHEVLMRLVDVSDVLIENMRPPVKYRLGFDFETVHARNPRLVYGSISGFGQDGPYASRGGVDQIAQGMGGLMSVTGLSGSEPTRAGIPVADLSAGLYLSIGVLVALHDRERTGSGRWVQTSLLESMIAMMDFQAARWTIDQDVPTSAGNHHPLSVPMGCFPPRTATSTSAALTVGCCGACARSPGCRGSRSTRSLTHRPGDRRTVPNSTRCFPSGWQRGPLLHGSKRSTRPGA